MMILRKAACLVVDFLAEQKAWDLESQDFSSLGLSQQRESL